MSNLKPNWQVEFKTTNVIENKIHEKESNNNENPAANINDNKENEKDKKVNEILNNKVSKIVFTLSCSEQGQLGVFPEQQENWKWIGDSIRKALEYEKIENEKKNIKMINPDEIISEDYSLRKEYSKKAQKTSPTPISQKNDKNNQNTKKKDTENSKDLPIRKFLNGFAYTGGSSLAALSVNDYSFETVISSDNIMSSSSALQVVHLDAAKSSVQWAMRNAVASGLISSTEGDSDSDSNDRGDNNSSSSISNGESSDSADKSNDNNRNGNSNSDSNSNDADVENNKNNKNNNDRNERSDKKIIGDKNKQSSALSSSPSLLTSSSSSSLFVSSSTSISTSSSTSFPHTSSARWITDDCLTFLEREIRRGNKYDGLIFDPPAFGRASSGKIWKLEKDLPVLVEELIPQLLSSDPLFVLLSCHDVSWPPEKLAEILSVAMSSVMKNAMLLNIKAMKKNKASAAAAQVISKNGKNDRDKDKLKDNENKNKNIVKKGPKNTPENSDKNIQSVFLAGGILEYGPMILTPNKFKNNVRKLEIGNPLPLGGFARWSKIID